MDILLNHARLISWEVLKARTLGDDYIYARAKFDALRPSPTGSPLEEVKAEYVEALNNIYNVGMGTPYSRAIIDVIPDLSCGDQTGGQLTCAVIPGISVGI